MVDRPAPLAPTTGLTVLHLFVRGGFDVDAGAVRAALDAARDDGAQVVLAVLLGHRADACVMALCADAWVLRDLQTGLVRAGLELADSYVSLTEVSEYAAGLPEEMVRARLYPTLPPEGLRAFCFYPMSKRRGERDNWYELDYARRDELMRGHGKVGREFKGRVLQVVTGSTGVEEASARFGEFGPFYAGVVASVDEVLGRALA